MSLLDSEPVEAVHGDDGRRLVCDECGAQVKNLRDHRWRMHSESGRARQEARRAAPKADRQPGAPRARTGAAGGRKRSLKADLEVSYGLLAEFWRMRDPVCGTVALQQVPKIALAWDTAAQNNARLHAALEKMMGGAGLAGVALAHAPIIMIVVAHHGPQRDQYFPPASPPPAEQPTAEQPVMNGDGAWPQGGPVTGEYAAASADRAR